MNSLKSCEKLKGRIAIVSCPSLVSGLTQYSFYLMKALLEYGNREDVFLVCYKHDEYDASCAENIAGVIHRTRLLPVSVIRVLWFVISKKIEIVHLQSFFKYPPLTYVLIWIFQKLGKKVVFTAHDIFPHYQRPWDPWFTSKIYEQADGIIAHSKTNLISIMKVGYKLRKTKIIHHPLYSNFNNAKRLEKKSARQKIGLDKNKRVLLFFGKIDRRKGVEAFMREFPKLIEKDPDCHLVLAGRDGFPKGYLKSISSQLGILNNVTIMDKFIAEEDVAPYFAGADAVVLPYLKGSTSGVLKVAFAFKTPVIATRVGEMPELVTDYHAGALIALPLNSKDIDSILSVADNSRSGKFYSNYEDLQKQFSWDIAAWKTVGFYNELLQDS